MPSNSLAASARNFAVLVAGAGSAIANSIYVRENTIDFNPANNAGHYTYRQPSQLGRPDQNYGINWSIFNAAWEIYGAAGNRLYYSNSNVTEPWDATGWTADLGSNPVPTVTQA